MSKASQTVKAVVFVLISVLIVVVLYSLIFRVDFFSTGIEYLMEFDSIGTIVTGSPIRKAGVKIGSVIQVSINPETQRTVLLRVRLFPGNIIRTSDRISILTGGLLGDQFIDVAPGDPSAPPYPPNALIKGRPSFDFASIAASGEDVIREIARLSASVASLLDRNSEPIHRTVQNLERLSAELMALGRTAQTLESRINEVSTELNRTLTAIQRAANQIESLTQNLNSPDSLLTYANRPATRNRIDAILAELQDVSRNLNQITRDISAMLKP